MKKLLAAMFGCALLSGCGSAPGVYDLPVEEAYARLQKADIDGFRMARQCGMLIYFKAEETPGKSIRWTVTSSGRKVASFAVRLVPQGNRTRVEIGVPPDPAGGEIYDGKKVYRRPAFNQPLRPALWELVDAAMAQRPYNGFSVPKGDSICAVQRTGLESGRKPFSLDDDEVRNAENNSFTWKLESAPDNTFVFSGRPDSSRVN